MACAIPVVYLGFLHSYTVKVTQEYTLGCHAISILVGTPVAKRTGLPYEYRHTMMTYPEGLVNMVSLRGVSVGTPTE